MPPPSQHVKRWQQGRAKLQARSAASLTAPQFEANRRVDNFFCLLFRAKQKREPNCHYYLSNAP